MNTGLIISICICILILIAIVFTIRKIIKDKKDDKGCDGNCAFCVNSYSCDHKK